MSTTVIRNIDWCVAWDPASGGHAYRRNVDLAFDGGVITYLGRRFDGAADAEIDGSRSVVLPGLVNVHSHPLSEPLCKGVTDDGGNPQLGFSGLYDLMPVYDPDEAGMRACAEVAYSELLLSGVTTLVNLSVPYEGWLDLLAASGLRGVAAPMFRSARWFTRDGRSFEYEWSADSGAASLNAALDTVDAALNHPSGRLSAMIAPAQIDTCTADLLTEAQGAAAERNIGLQIHAAQSLVEFSEITRRHGLTPIQWLAALDLLGERTTIAHAIFLDSHDWIRWATHKDLALIAESGTGVAHCPTVFARHGMLLRHLGGYCDAGVRLGLGTDTFPHNMWEEMRLAALLGRAAAPSFRMISAADVFALATLGGAAILGREDIGRLTPGARADLVMVDGEHPAMRPLRDPLRSLVHSAAERAVDRVFVDGHLVAEGGCPLHLDQAGALARLDEARIRVDRRVPELDWAGRSTFELAPLSLPLLEESGTSG